MNLPTITLDKGEAEAQYRAYLEAFGKTGDEEDELLKKLYYELKQGHPVLRLHDALKAAGLNAEGLPKLAIACADEPQVSFTANPPFSWERGMIGGFYHGQRGQGRRGLRGAIPIPYGVYELSYAVQHGRDVQTVVPNVPPRFRPRGSLAGYHVLFEVDKWEPAPPRDPALLKQIGPGLYAVLAVWDLTDVEMLALSVTRGDGR